MSNFSRSGGFRKSTKGSMPNSLPAPTKPDTALHAPTLTVNGVGNVSTSMPSRFSAPSKQMPDAALLSSTPTANGVGNVSTSPSNQSVASKSTEVKYVDWPEYVGRATPMSGEQLDMKARGMKGTFNNAKLLKQIVDQNAEKANLLVGELPHSLIRPQSQAAHQPPHQPLVNNRFAVVGGSDAVLADTSARADTACPLRQKVLPTHVSGFKKSRDPVTTAPELSALEQMKNAGLKPGVNPNKVFYERSESSTSSASTEISQPKRVDTMGSELAKMRRLQEIMKAIQQNPILEDLVKNTMATIKKFANLNDEDSKLLDICFAYRY